jgi:cation diffusion facilitator CzcD-associated flavoprotein CzcO
LATSGGVIDTRQAIVATGYEHTPNLPVWQGRDAFAGDVLHSSGYRNPAPYIGKRALVVGAGSSGMEIAHDLATGGAAKVWLSIRSAPNILLRSLPGGLPSDPVVSTLYHLPIRIADAVARRARRSRIGDLNEFGLPIPREGPFARLARLGVVPAIVDMEVIDAIRDGSIEVVGEVARFDTGDALLVDGVRIDPGVVICATGYSRGLDTMIGHLGVLDALGAPRAAEGLRFLGYLARPSLIGYCGKQARRAAKQIATELKAG